MVGIGASAGGLDAFRGFFENMPSDSGFAFVVVLHLPHNRKSMLAEIISRWTTMPVREVEGEVELAANRVYVPPPNSAVTFEGGALRARARGSAEPRDDRPIDGLFDGLAATYGEQAIGIVLSGTGSDGALGLKAIKTAGGFTLAQGGQPRGNSASKPEYDGMPAGAIATGAVDLALAVEAMPDALARLRPTPNQDKAAGPAEQMEEQRLAICAILRRRVGHDFSGYKDKTFLRRVQRRMQVLGVDAVPDYVARLDAGDEEATLLFKDLLIRVTSFFRDAETFELLAREVVPRLFAGKRAEDMVRVWVPGCATGEEAYTLAILLREHMDTLSYTPKAQVFATDIDEPAIGSARAGRYPRTLLDGLSPARRRRFFLEQDNSFVVRKEIRDLCTFSGHSLVRDPPFSRMDLISCRNLLIYLDADSQASIIPAFHYSLVEGGMLLLGSAESAARHEELFEPIDKSARIYRRRSVRSPPFRFPPGDMDGAAKTTYRREARGTDAHEAARRWSDLDKAGANRPAAAPAGWIGHAGHGVRSGLRAARGLLPAGKSETARLKLKLRETSAQLQSITEEHDTALEELRSANEELHSVNEELQSTNEELETSKEELQSVNEELHTVNAQLSEKIEELDRSASDMKNLFDSTDVATIFLDRHMIIRGFTPAVASIYNLIPSDHGRPLTDIVGHLAYDGLHRDVRRVLDTLLPLERRVSREDGAMHYILRILPYRAPDSSIDGVLVTFLDVTSIVQAETHQRLLIDELNHRVKNMLTVVISLTQQTLRRADTLDDFSDAFMGRIKALTSSYSLLSEANWNSVELRDVLMNEIRPFLSEQRENVVLDGPSILLPPQAALALGMALHELVTNAVKYGALSEPSGSIDARWRVDGAPAACFVLDWTERDGPAVTPPTRRGFGTTLIERGFAHELSGSASMEFAPAGLRVTLSAPLGQASPGPLTNQAPA